MELLAQRYSNKIHGTISCYDRVVIIGTLPTLCYAEGITSYFYAHKIRIFDYPRFAEPYRDQIRENAEKIARDNEIEIEFIKKAHIRKEDLVMKVLEKRGYAPGLVHILSCMEACPSYKPWHDKPSGRTFLKSDSGKCLHYYFYFIDNVLGLCYVRVPTWLPFQLQIYFNGHNWLASELQKKSLEYNLVDNAFDYIEDFEKAQKISDNLKTEILHKHLNRFAEIFCPVYKQFGEVYHWSIMQCEYSTDIIFKKRSDLQSIYENLIRTAIHTVKPGNIATFLGKKLHGNFEGEAGNDYGIRIEGTRIKHSMGPVSIKMYDKFGKILRIETTVNKVSFFKHYREVEHRNGKTSLKEVHMKKNIYSLFPLKDKLKMSNHRYLEFISAIEDKSVGKNNLDKISKPVFQDEKSFKGFNFFDDNDCDIFLAISRGEFNIYGFRNKNLKKFLVNKSPSQISRCIKRLLLHGIIKKARNCYKYYLTSLGKRAITTGMKLKELFIIPQLNFIQ